MLFKVILLTAVASNLPGVIAIETMGHIPLWVNGARVAVLLAATLFYWRIKDPGLARYAGILLAIVLVTLGIFHLGRTATWRGLFEPESFSGHFGSAISLKFLSTIPLMALLLYLFRSAKHAYLAAGDLSVKAEPIRWLGIHPDWISWRRLAVYSGFAIGAGTLLLTLITVTGFSMPDHLDQLPSHLPMILLFALVNSLSEGFIFRNAILATLHDLLPKNQVILVAAAFFGLAHFYGAPSGVVGVIMSGLLGWYMCRSMYETGGFIAPWIIHFMQDTVIFTTLVLLGQVI